MKTPFKSLLLAVALSNGLTAATAAQPASSGYFPPPDSANGWRTATDPSSARELAGMDMDRLEQAWNFTQRCTQNGGLLVVRNGYLVFEKYFGRAGRNVNPDMASTGKAYTSIACGIMLNEFHDKIPNGLASMVLRRITGMDLQAYLNERLAKPMGWGAWDYCLHRGDFTMPHANGAGSIAVHATDALRFGYCLLRGGKWGDQQLVPADYLALCNQMSPHNPHSPYTLMFEQNSDGHVAGAPRDGFWKSGAGGFAIIIVPSLDLVIYKMGGSNGQYNPTLTNVPQPEPDHSRDDWKPIPRTPFHEGSLGGDNGIRRVLEMVSAAVRE